MNQIIKLILPNIFWTLAIIIIWNKLLNKKLDFNSKKSFVFIFILMTFSILNYILVEKFIRIILITALLMLLLKIFYKENIQKSIITPLFSQLIMFLSESFCLVILVLLLKMDPNYLLNNYFGIFLTNFIISVISILICNIKFVIKLYNRMIKFTDKIKSSELLIFCLIIIIIINVVDMSTYYKISINYLMLINISLMIICTIIVLYSLITKNNYNKVSNKYNVAIESLKNYEQMMTKYRIANHENKNMLMTIRTMIINKDKNIDKYIDSILKNKYIDDEKLLIEMINIPVGGLRATIYSEILKIKDKKISYNLIIDNLVKSINLLELDTSTMVDVCKIICVFIDNSIEEVEKLKEKYINIEIYEEEDYLNIKISNNYKNKIEVDKIFLEGYTTKGKEHGYGLPLVKQIVSKNILLENETIINKNVFTQLVKIKYKTKK